MIFGLEIEELAMLLVWVGICIGLFNVFLALFTALPLWFVLVKTKQGHPAGFLMHLLYFHLGVPLNGFLPSPKKVKHYSIWKQEEENSLKSGLKVN